MSDTHANSRAAGVDATVPVFRSAADKAAVALFARDCEGAPGFAAMRRRVVRCLADFQLIKAGDRVLVAVSGGKDSTLLLLLLEDIRRRSPIPFAVHPLLIDQKQPGFNVDRYMAWLAARGFRLEVLEEDTYTVVVEKTARGKSFCGLCSRLRRGILYTYAQANGFNKVALGHHRDDVNETLLMNLFFHAKIGSMPPKIKAKGKPVQVIRPLFRVTEADLARSARAMDIPVIPCNLCRNQEGLVRREMKELLARLAVKHPKSGQNMFKALANIQNGWLPPPARSLAELEKT